MLLDPGLDIILWLQSLPDGFLAFMRWVSIMGQGGFYLLAIALVFWALDRKAAARLFLFLTFSGSINAFLKMLLHMPRPYWLDSRVRPMEFHSSYGMPSGHAQTAAVTWGGTAWAVGRRWAWAAALSAIVLIGVSRVALGVHSPAQVLVGWAIGFMLLVAFISFDAKVWPLLARWQTISLVVGLFLLAAAVLGAGIVGHQALAGWRVPEAWMAAAGKSFGTDPLPLKDVFQSTGAFLGFALGALWTARSGRWNLPETRRNRIVEIVVGLAGLTVLLASRHLLYPGGWAGQLWYFGMSTTAGFWISGLAPWLAVQVRRVVWPKT